MTAQLTTIKLNSPQDVKDLIAELGEAKRKAARTGGKYRVSRKDLETGEEVIFECYFSVESGII